MAPSDKDTGQAAGRQASGDIEYPQVAYVNDQCINIVASLWHTPEPLAWKSGAVARSNEEACVIAATAAWLRWRELMMAEGRLPASPNFVIPSSHPSIWDNFSHLWNIEMRSPSDCPDGSDPNALTQLCDDNTICVIYPISSGRQASIHQIELLDHAIGDLNAHRLRPVPLHIDAGDEGLLLPFTAPEMIWDFRLANVTSISAYCPDGSQTFPGTGFVCWRDRKCVPGGMLFAVNYLGTEISQIGLNFSRSSDSLMEHYPRYVRLGYDGIRNAVLSRQH